MLWLGFLAVGCRANFDLLGGSANQDAGLHDGTAGGDAMSSQLTIVVVGQGAVTGPGAIACATGCSYPASGAVTLTAQPAEGWRLVGFSAPCTGQSTCIASPGTTVTASFERAPIVANRVFVTANLPPLAGLASIDTFCNQSASAAGIAGSYVAFLSTSTADARDRLVGSRGWVRLDGLPLFDLPGALDDPHCARGVAFDETTTPQNQFVMTGSTVDGTKVTGRCAEWTTTVGTGFGGSSRNAYPGIIATGSSTSCAQRVYCFEVGKTVPIALQPLPFPVGRYIFMANSPFASGTGVVAADAQCGADAAAAGLPGAYAAILATSTTSAATHIGGSSGIWRRPDGIVVSFNGLDHALLDAAIGVVDTVAGQAGAVRVVGWSFDPEGPSIPLQTHVYIGTVGTNLGLTAVDRPDVNAVKGTTGKHGFDSVVSTDLRGDVKVCIAAINIAAGDNEWLSCSTVTVTN